MLYKYSEVRVIFLSGVGSEGRFSFAFVFYLLGAFLRRISLKVRAISAKITY